jgi:hypothetical protein
VTTTTTKKKPATKRPAAKPAATPIHPLSHFIPDASLVDAYIDRAVVGDKTGFEFLDMAYLGTTDQAESAGRASRFNLLIEGPSGSAKTTMVEAWAALHQRPVLTISCHSDIDTDALIGGPGIDTNGNIRQFVPGPLVQFMMYGGAVVWDEQNYASPKKMGRFNSLFDRRRTLMLPEAAGTSWCSTCGLYNDPDRVEQERRALAVAHTTGKGAAKPVLCEHCNQHLHSDFVKAHPEFFVISVQNPGYVGTYEMNEAQRNRYNICMNFDYDPAVESELLWSSKLLEFADNVRSRLGTDVSLPLGTNRLIDFEFIAMTEGIGIACENLVSYFPEEDRAAIRTTLEQYVPEIIKELAD